MTALTPAQIVARELEHVRCRDASNAKQQLRAPIILVAGSWPEWLLGLEGTTDDDDADWNARVEP